MSYERVMNRVFTLSELIEFTTIILEWTNWAGWKKCSSRVCGVTDVLRNRGRFTLGSLRRIGQRNDRQRLVP